MKTLPWLQSLLIALTVCSVAGCADDNSTSSPVDDTNTSADGSSSDTSGSTSGSTSSTTQTNADTSISDDIPTATDTNNPTTADTNNPTTADTNNPTDITDPTDTNIATDTTEPVDTTEPPDLIDTTEPPTGLPDGPSSERFTAYPLGTSDAGQGYYEYLPPGYGDGQRRPLLLFFHGIGENGNGDSELPRVLNNGLARMISRDEWPSDRPFIVLSPQHPGGGCHTPAEIEALLTHAVTHYDVDPTRIYLTGLSCGAIGVWNYLGSARGEVVAAAVPIAGDGQGAWNQAGCELGEVALWAFHGDADGTVGVNGTNVPIDNLLANCPSPPRKEAIKTIYPGVGHDSWTRTYNLSAGHDIYAWLLTHTNPNATIPNTSTDPLVRGRTIQIDFGVPAATSPAPWNNITTASGSVFDLVDFTGVTTKVDVRITEPFTGTNDQGVPNNALGFPASVTSDVLWLGSFDGHDAALPMRATLLIEDLEPTARYEISAFGARAGNDGGLGRLTRYTLGSTFIDVDASDNTANKATFSNLQPDANGTLRLEITVSPAGTGRFAYLSALEITRTAE